MINGKFMIFNIILKNTNIFEHSSIWFYKDMAGHLQTWLAKFRIDQDSLVMTILYIVSTPETKAESFHHQEDTVAVINLSDTININTNIKLI